MKQLRFAISVGMIFFVSIVATGCKKACDDLADVCGSCNSDYKSSCDAEHDACDILKGRLGNDCCETAIDMWESSCK